LKGINKAQKSNARRLLQCLTIAARPLHVEELAELLAFDFQASSSGGIPKLREDWRWDNQEEAVLSTCSSLVTIVPSGNSRVVQFSHFSVKEYLTSPRLARSLHRDVSQFYVDLEPAHTIMAQACLATLLRLDKHAGSSDHNGPPLAKYAAQHWADHAQFENVTSRVRDAMENLFDSSKPHFAAWIQVHDIDTHWFTFSRGSPDNLGSPLYYAAFCGFYDLAECLVMKHPEQVNARRGRMLSPLPAALYNKHFRVADLLHEHSADVDIRGISEMTPLHAASVSGQIDIMQWLLDHGADAHTYNWNRCTPLHTAAFNMHTDAVQVLLQHEADPNLRDDILGQTPLYKTLVRLNSVPERKVVDIVRLLLENGANTNIRDYGFSTALHQVLSRERLAVAQLLLSYGAKEG
jgi:ankyrin repeat protein